MSVVAAVASARHFEIESRHFASAALAAESKQDTGRPMINVRPFSSLKSCRRIASNKCVSRRTRMAFS